VDLVRKRQIPGGRDTTSHKLKPETVELILVMTASGESSASIRAAIKGRWGVTVHPNLISYYRRTRAARIAELGEALIEEARENYAFASLTERIGALNDIATQEIENPNGGSARTIVNAITGIGDALFKSELITIRAREIAYNVERSESQELILQELERRSHIPTSEKGGSASRKL